MFLLKMMICFFLGFLSIQGVTCFLKVPLTTEKNRTIYSNSLLSSSVKFSNSPEKWLVIHFQLPDVFLFLMT